MRKEMLLTALTDEWKKSDPNTLKTGSINAKMS